VPRALKATKPCRWVLDRGAACWSGTCYKSGTGAVEKGPPATGQPDGQQHRDREKRARVGFRRAAQRSAAGRLGWRGSASRSPRRAADPLLMAAPSSWAHSRMCTVHTNACARLTLVDGVPRVVLSRGDGPMSSGRIAKKGRPGSNHSSRGGGRARLLWAGRSSCHSPSRRAPSLTVNP
jgi:hypothetical protein